MERADALEALDAFVAGLDLATLGAGELGLEPKSVTPIRMVEVPASLLWVIEPEGVFGGVGVPFSLA